MPAYPDFDEFHVAQFSNNLKQKVQQMDARFAGRTDVMSCSGEQAQVILQVSEQDPTELAPPSYNGSNYDGWYGDTVWGDIEHTQRWMTPTVWQRALPISANDTRRMLVDPQASYLQALAAGFHRKHDDVVIAAALGNVLTGKYDSLSQSALPAAQKNEHATLSTVRPLSLDLLIETWEQLNGDEANEMGEEVYWVTNANGLASLLQEEKLTSNDYANVKALVAGNIDTFMGFKFIRSERLPTTVNAGAGDYDVRHNFAYVKSGLTMGVWQDMTVRVDPRPDKNYVNQIYVQKTCGAARTEDKKVIQVDITIPGTNA